MFVSILVIFLLFASALAHEVKRCRKNTEHVQKHCDSMSPQQAESLDLPIEACVKTSCSNCIIGWKTLLWREDDTFISPTLFMERPTSTAGNTSYFQCSETDIDRGDAMDSPCDCSSNCTGTTDFCSLYPCHHLASCKCDIKKVRYEMLHFEENRWVSNTTIISFEICLFRKPQAVRGNRHLLEFESAQFVQHNLSLSFNEPVVTLSSPGKLIARISGNEVIYDVKEDLNVILPIELIAFKDKLTLIFISLDGKAVHGEIYLEGKTICRSTNCVFCKEFVYQSQCWPRHIAYTLYCIIAVFAVLFLLFLRLTLKGLMGLIKTLLYGLLLSFKLIRSILRISLLGGAVVGTSARRHIENFHQFLENNAHQQVRRNALPLVLLTLLATVTGDCTSHSIISSDLQNCQTFEGQQKCAIFTTAEITLKNLEYQTCLWFQDTKKNNLFHLKFKLVSAQCKFSSKRLYFTFPVQEKTISQLACPQNYYCAWGTHCIPNKEFEALTEESKAYPGTTNCHPSSVGSGCTIISRMGCLFYRVYYVPDLIHSYEVRSVVGHQCSYTIAVERSENNTSELLTFHSSAQTKDGIFVEIQGALNQPQLHFSDSLVVRVGNPAEAYLTPTSPQHIPRAGLVGQIQANQSFTKTFLFDPEITKCDFFETTLRCSRKPDSLEIMVNSKEKALPLTKDLHLFSMDKNSLKSQLLSTAPVKLSLSFSDYKITLQTTQICPKILDKEVTAKGCYSCQILSELKFFAHSSCQSGAVSVEFQKITLYTQSVILETEPKEFIIKFQGDEKCYEEKLCLVSREMKHCKLLSFCLSEPSINLINFNSTYTNSILTDDSSGSGFFNFLSLSAVNNIFFGLKMIGTLLIIICLSITVLSTCITCCKR